jgi:hypothetical protein
VHFMDICGEDLFALGVVSESIREYLRDVA